MNSTFGTPVCSKSRSWSQLKGLGVSDRYCPSYYDILMVSPVADAATVRAAFRALIRTWHPDCSGRADCGEQGGSQDRASQIIQAYRTLSHPERRRQYDRRRQQIPILPGSDRRHGERRQPSPQIGCVDRAVHRRRTMLWIASTGSAALVAIATFLPALSAPTDFSRDVLRALM
ncbi:J domain-containing protein [Sphingomonas sp. LB3N6]|uniref:J domain-containing protein n=1 Tax=Sphingomonas fucosidasi TaxID=3096164 RepID=UPI003FA7DA4E